MGFQSTREKVLPKLTKHDEAKSTFSQKFSKKIIKNNEIPGHFLQIEKERSFKI